METILDIADGEVGVIMRHDGKIYFSKTPMRDTPDPAYNMYALVHKLGRTFLKLNIPIGAHIKTNDHGQIEYLKFSNRKVGG